MIVNDQKIAIENMKRAFAAEKRQLIDNYEEEIRNSNAKHQEEMKQLHKEWKESVTKLQYEMDQMALMHKNEIRKINDAHMQDSVNSESHLFIRP